MIVASHGGGRSLFIERQHLRGVLPILVSSAALLGACACLGPGESDETEPSEVDGAPQAPQTSASAPRTTVADSTSQVPQTESTLTPITSSVPDTLANDDAIDLLLAQSIGTTEVGDGVGTSCQSPGDVSPAVVLVSAFAREPNTVAAGDVVRLCLFGFAADEPVEVVTLLRSSQERFRTVLEVGDGAPGYLYPFSECEDSTDSFCDAPREPTDFLFEDGLSATLHENYEYEPEGLSSNDWWLVPSAIDVIVGDGGFEVTATQGSTTVTASPSVTPAGADATYWLQASNSSPSELLVKAPPSGSPIPLGLYAGEPRSFADVPGEFCPDPLLLVDVVGRLVIGTAGIARFSVPDSVVSQMGEGGFIFTTPVRSQMTGAYFVNGQRDGTCTVVPLE